MKQYYITSLYSQDLQVSVQQDHACSNMIKNILENQNTEAAKVYKEYIDKHQTTICLGVSQPMELLKIYAYMHKHKDELNIPMGIFQEPSMNYTATALTFVTNEKLSYPIAREIRSIFKDNNIRSFYEFHNSMTLKNFNKTMTIEIDFDKNCRPVFHIEFVQTKFKSAQNNELMPKELTNEILEKLYQEQNEEDYLFYENNSLNPYKKAEKETIKVSYSLAEIVFLDMISVLRLK